MDKIIFIYIMCWLSISHSSMFAAPGFGLQILSNQIITSCLKIFPMNILIMENASF
uniref:Uncharacterized protein n=1 Tax=Cebus imitator TaxID=2715852 RepID=A0A2K5QCJ7_CEBIM